MTKRLTFIITILVVLAAALLAADISGKWAGEMQGRNGAQPVTFTFKQTGDALTGTTAGRGGDVEIKDGKVTGDDVVFTVPNQRGDIKYTGKVAGSELKLSFDRGRGPQELTLKKQ